MSNYAQRVMVLWRERLADAARYVIASRPPLGVTWRHPYRVSPEALAWWKTGTQEQQPIFVHPEDFEQLAAMVQQALTRPRYEDALALQCRMAERFPAP